jgi:transcriptional regulator with XRE-family HTH domain
MKLSDYIKDQKITQAKIGLAAGISKAHISQICRLGRRPSPDVAVRISQATNGAVTVLDLLYPDGIEETESVAV